MQYCHDLILQKRIFCDTMTEGFHKLTPGMKVRAQAAVPKEEEEQPADKTGIAKNISDREKWEYQRWQREKKGLLLRVHVRC